MPSSGNYNTSALGFLAAARPRDNWEARRQQKRDELQLLNIQEARARQDADELQLGIQQQIASIQQIKALPAEAPDRPLIKGFVESQIKEALNRINTDYNGDYRKFIEAEGQSFTEQMKSNFLSSPVYARVERNKTEMELARKALAKGESLIGTLNPTNGQYLSADEQIQMFNEGKSPGFTFRGSYDPTKVNAYEYFSKTYNPNGSKFERSKVSEEEKAAYAQSELGGLAGMDYYFQSLRNSPVYYKSDPVEDRTMFNLDVANKRMDLAQGQSQINRNNAAAAKDLADAQKQDTEPVQQSYFQKTFNNVLTNNTLPSYNPNSPNNNKMIPSLGIRVGDIATNINGKPGINMRKYPNSDASDLANKSVGITESKVKGKTQYSGSLPGILDASGEVNYLDLTGVKHRVRATDSFIYVDGAEDESRIPGGRMPSRAWKYYEVVIGQDAGKNLGIDKSKLRKVGTEGSKDVYGYVLKGFTPVQNFVNDKNVDQTLTKRQQGQKQSNEIFGTKPAQPKIFNWD